MMSDLSRVSVAVGASYGSLALFISILYNVFLLYHVETFVSVYKIDKVSFWIGEVIFLIWNSFNDPLFGWLSDKKYLNSHPGNKTDIVLRRLNAILFNGPLYAMSFLLFWVSWIWPSAQFVISLCVFDGFLSVISLHTHALLADLAVCAKTRTVLSSYSSAFSAIGTVSVFLSYAIWNRTNMFSFQIFCGVLAVISIVGFVVACAVLKRNRGSTLESTSHNLSLQSTPVGDSIEEYGIDKRHLKEFVKNLLSHKNFMWFSCLNLIQVFHCHFNSNFFPLFLENLLGNAVTPATASFLLGISFVAPHINNLYFLSLCRRYGVYTVIKFLLVVKLLLSTTMWMIGADNILMLCLFIASNRVFTEGTCKLLNLVISDLVDEDFVLHNRDQAVSALMFGTAALLSKPGQTIAPLVGSWLLATTTGHDIFRTGNSAGGSIKVEAGESSDLRLGCFNLLIVVPVVCALLQLFAWSKFTLYGKRLLWVKSVREGSSHHTV